MVTPSLLQFRKQTGARRGQTLEWKRSLLRHKRETAPSMYEGP